MNVKIFFGFLIALVAFGGYFYLPQLVSSNTTTIENDPVSLLETIPLSNPTAESIPATDTAVLDFSKARNHIGESRTVAGTLQYVFNNGKATILGFKNHHRGAMKIRIMEPNYSSFSGDPASMYSIGDVIQVFGKIEWYQGDPVIYATKSSQIQIIK